MKENFSNDTFRAKADRANADCRIDLSEGIISLGGNCPGASVISGIFFNLLFGCPTDHFGPLSRGKPHLPEVSQCIF